MAIGPTLQEGRVFSFRTPLYAQDELAVGEFVGREALSRPFEYRIELLSRIPSVDSAGLILRPATLRFKRPVARGKPGAKLPPVVTTQVHGVVSALTHAERFLEWTVYRAVLVPRLWRLSLGKNSAIYQNLSVPQVVASVLKKRGLSDPADFRFQLSRSYPQREYVVQYDESDLAFLSRLLEHEGIFYYFDHSGASEAIVLADGSAAYDERTPVTLEYRDAGAPESELSDWGEPEGIRRFFFEHRAVESEIALRDHNCRTPSVPLEATGSETDPNRDGTSYDHSTHHRTSAEAQSLARIRLEELACREKRYSGSGTCLALRPGSLFSLQKHPQFSGSYVIFEIESTGRQELSLGPGGRISAKYRTEFFCLPSSRTFRPERATPRPRIPGVLRAFVDSSDDSPYAELDSEGQYKVRLQFDRSGVPPGCASRPLRMAQPYAGPGFGMHFPLHKGTEVLLTHVNGDPDRPVLAAAVYDASTSNVVTSANQTECVLRTPAGNELRFDDLAGSERILLRAEKDWLSEVKNDRSLTVGRDDLITIGRDQSATILQDRSVTIGRHDARIVGGDARVSVTGDEVAKIGRDASLEASRDRGLSVGRDHQVRVGRDHTEEIGGDRHLTVSGQHAVEIGGQFSLTVNGGIVEYGRGDHSEELSGTWCVKATDVVLLTVSRLTLHCGPSSIVLDSNGVTIAGPTVVVDAQRTMINSGPGTPPDAAIYPDIVLPALPAASKLKAGKSPAATPTFIAFRLVDETGTPLAGEPYEVTSPDGTFVQGTLDATGSARVEGVEPGNCQVTFPERDQGLITPGR